MIDHGIAWLPVVQSKDDPRPVGCVRGEKIGNRIMQKIGHSEADHARAAN
jgi:hypothetical protein